MQGRPGSSRFASGRIRFLDHHGRVQPLNADERYRTRCPRSRSAMSVIRYLVDGSADGSLGSFELTVPPGSNVPPPHSQLADTEESFTMLDGLSCAMRSGMHTRGLVARNRCFRQGNGRSLQQPASTLRLAHSSFSRPTSGRKISRMTARSSTRANRLTRRQLVAGHVEVLVSFLRRHGRCRRQRMKCEDEPDASRATSR